MGFDWLPAKNYKRHCICLSCQKGFKRPSKEDMKNPVSADLSNLMEQFYASHSEEDILAFIGAAHAPFKVVCPNCGGEMVEVHYNFEVPRQRDQKSWRALQETMAAKNQPPYGVYTQWHRLALQKADGKSAAYKLLKQNLKKLEAALRSPGSFGSSADNS